MFQRADSLYNRWGIPVGAVYVSLLNLAKLDNPMNSVYMRNVSVLPPMSRICFAYFYPCRAVCPLLACFLALGSPQAMALKPPISAATCLPPVLATFGLIDVSY